MYQFKSVIKERQKGVQPLSTKNIGNKLVINAKILGPLNDIIGIYEQKN